MSIMNCLFKKEALFYRLLILFLFSLLIPLQGQEIYITSVHNHTGKPIILVSGKVIQVIDHRTSSEKISFPLQDFSIAPSKLIDQYRNITGIIINVCTVFNKSASFKKKTKNIMVWEQTEIDPAAGNFIYDFRNYYNSGAELCPEVLSSFNIHLKQLSWSKKADDIFLSLTIKNGPVVQNFNFPYEIKLELEPQPEILGSQ